MPDLRKSRKEGEEFGRKKAIETRRESIRDDLSGEVGAHTK